MEIGGFPFVSDIANCGCQIAHSKWFGSAACNCGRFNRGIHNITSELLDYGLYIRSFGVFKVHRG
jgi:hypothetical protein